MTRTHIAAAVTGAALLYAARRYYRNWGTTKEECRRQLPGDELVGAPALQSTEGVLIDAPVRVVWPWLMQLGGHATRPEWQRLDPGDSVRLGPPGWLGRRGSVLLRVSGVVDKQSIVLRGTPPEFPWDAVWSFHLEPHWDDQCRLLVRTKAGLRHPGQVFITEAAGPVVSLTVRGMLLWIKERAEAVSLAARTPEPAA